jgi:outer membrane protein assembly factor BamB
MELNYIIIKSLLEVDKFDFTVENEIGFIKKNKAYILNDKLNKISIDLPNKSTSLFFFKTDFYVTDSELLLTKIYTNLYQKTTTLKYLISIPTTIEKRNFENYLYPIVYEKKTKKRYNGVFNRDNYEIKDSYELSIGLNGIYKVINDNLFLSQNNEKFALFTFDNTCVWEIFYTDLFKEYESIGAGTTNILKVESHLYIELDKTYCVDLNTGNLKYTYDQKFTNSENEFLYGLQFLSMEKFQLAILNTKTNDVEIIDISDEFNKNNIYPDNRIVVSEKLIYFSQNMGDTIAKIGVLNPESGKILWKYNFENKNGMIGTLEVNGNRIYALTQDKTLHIFEKDNTLIF